MTNLQLYVAALREAREYILDNGDERSMAPVIERIDSVLRGEPPERIDPYRPAHTADVAPTTDSTAGPALSGNRGAPHE